MHGMIFLMFVVAVIIAGALGYAFRGAIRKEVAAAGSAAKVDAQKLEAWAQRLEQTASNEAHAVAVQIRAELSKL